MADWQYTKWGMTPDEVVAASGGTVKQIVAKAKSDELAEGIYSSAAFKFTVTFGFDRGKLNVVRLKTVPIDEMPKAAGALDAVYGKPIEATSKWNDQRVCLQTSRRWRDEASGNEVRYFNHSCIKSNISDKSTIASIIYSPIETKASTGL